MTILTCTYEKFLLAVCYFKFFQQNFTKLLRMVGKMSWRLKRVTRQATKSLRSFKDKVVLRKSASEVFFEKKGSNQDIYFEPSGKTKNKAKFCTLQTVKETVQNVGTSVNIFSLINGASNKEALCQRNI